ncbi:hypothetical protein TWF696_008449 [Orbilia brochopaga]|uniref:Uncharacterized protein n=1 Tax=Orbilia brochopaga TaxID=3140254 RepID=A0AAV9UGV7_9PEZI
MSTSEISSSQTKEELAELANIQINQMRARLMIGVLDADDELREMIQAYHAWMSASTDPDPQNASDLSIEDLLEERSLSFGWDAVTYMFPYLGDYKITREQRDRIAPLSKLCCRVNSLYNDICGFEHDWSTNTVLDKEPTIKSSVILVMRAQNVTVEEAKHMVMQMAQKEASNYVQLRNSLLIDAEPGVIRWITDLHYFYAGTAIWQQYNSRYRYGPELPYLPKPEHKFEDLPRNPDSAKENSSDVHQEDQPLTDAVSWTLEYPYQSEQIALVPFEYVASLPSKKIRKIAIDALNYWYDVPQSSLSIINSVIDMLHSSSLMIDDIEDGSELRRGNPATHTVFGIAQTINAANYLFVKCLREVQKLGRSSLAVSIYEGQGFDLHWTFHKECPTEREYIRMIDGKTGGLFRMAARLMRAEARQNSDLDVKHLMTLMGRFFQIRDDYQNLSSSEYSAAKGDLSDLDEGKYSLMLIHALTNAKPHDTQQLKSLLQLRTQGTGLSPEQKNLIMKILARSKSMDYALRVIRQLQVDIGKMVEGIESNLGVEKNWTIHLIMALLRLNNVDSSIPI